MDFSIKLPAKFETALNSININSISRKPKVLFLDSSAINNMFVNLSDVRYQNLFNKLKELVGVGKLIIPYGQQYAEIQRNENDYIAINGFNQLTNDWEFYEYETIQKMQLYKFFEFHIQVFNSMKLKTYTLQDLSTIIDEYHSILFNKSKPFEFLFNKHDGITKEHVNIEIYRNRNKTKLDLAEAMNKLGNKSDLSYTQLLAKEFCFEFESFFECLRAITENSDDINLLFSTEVIKEIIFLGESFFYDEGKNMHLNNIRIVTFLASVLKWNVPCIQIERKLIAQSLAKKKYVASDTRDFEFVQYYAPYCDFFLTDKALSNVCKNLEFEEKYLVEFFSMSTLDKLYDELNKL